MNIPTLLSESFKNRRVFVTGHTGFKGSWLCLWLERLGAVTTGYALAPPTNPSNFNVSKVRDTLAAHHEGDIRDQPKLHAAMRESEPDLVLHLAAQSVVRDGYKHPFDTFDVNVMGTASVLEGVRKLDKPCSVLCITSDKCYENVEQVWGYRESDAFGDHDPYGGSKGAAEIVVRSYRHSFFAPQRYSQHGIKLASARAGNVVGGGDWTSHALIVDLVKALTSGEPARIRSPDSFRPWQHVLQALSGYLTLSAKLLGSDDPQLCSGWNIGPKPGNEIPVRDVVESFLGEWGEGSWVDASDPNQPPEANILRLCIDKALWELNWKPGWSVQETLRQTARWYRAYIEGPQSMRELSLEQIDQYEATLRQQPVTPSVPLDSSFPVGQLV
jgi:CDP-glucose 4,6-dehydratase